MLKLTIQRRKVAGPRAKTTVAPFINGYNVGDLPPKEWTPAVQQAVVRAYILGVDMGLAKLAQLKGMVAVELTQADGKDLAWKET